MPICPVPKIDLDFLDPYEIKPVGKLVWVKLPRLESTTDSGIVLIEGTEEPPSVGTVIATGKHIYDIPVGSIIHFAKYAPGTEYTYRDDKFKFVSETDVIGIVELPS